LIKQATIREMICGTIFWIRRAVKFKIKNQRTYSLCFLSVVFGFGRKSQIGVAFWSVCIGFFQAINHACMQPMTLLKKINRGALKMSWRRAGRHPVSVNGGRAAGLATASVNTFTKAHWRSLLEANLDPGPPSSQRIYEAVVYFASLLITSNSRIRVHPWILQNYPERTTCNHVYCFSCILHRLTVIAG